MLRENSAWLFCNCGSCQRINYPKLCKLQYSKSCTHTYERLYILILGIMT
uniref:Uncharacterized protein n=1 Tax=Rhizophora mucronata TaxID=61149 RepID=A0A2P2Q3L9_RHIMU